MCIISVAWKKYIQFGSLLLWAFNLIQGTYTKNQVEFLIVWYYNNVNLYRTCMVLQYQKNLEFKLEDLQYRNGAATIKIPPCSEKWSYLIPRQKYIFIQSPGGNSFPPYFHVAFQQIHKIIPPSFLFWSHFCGFIVRFIQPTPR